MRSNLPRLTCSSSLILNRYDEHDNAGFEFISLARIGVFIRHQRSENSPSTRQNSLAKFHPFPERALLFHNNSPATLLCSPATTILNENPAAWSRCNL